MSAPVELRVGQIWEDRDRRMGGRRMVVAAIEGSYVWLRHPSIGQHRTRIRIDNLRARWRLVQNNAPASPEATEAAIRGAVAAEREAAIAWVLSHKGGDQRCEVCGCWELVTNIVDGLTHGDHVDPPAERSEAASDA